jgi:hypothetical protein
MCAVMAPWLMAAAMVTTAAAGAYAADTQKKAGEYQAQVAEQNANLDEHRANQVATIGAIEEERKRAQVRQMAGTQRANLAAQGIDLQSGTALDIIDETYTFGEVDALTIRANAMQEAWGYKTSATNERNSGRMAKWSGKRQATGTYLSTAANVASMGYQGYSSGAFSSGAKVGGVQRQPLVNYAKQARVGG